MNGRNRLRRTTLVLALLVLAAILTGVAASAATTAIPKQLTGGWVRNAAPAVSMVVSPRGRVEIYEIAVDHAKLSRVTAHRLRISGIRSCSGTGTYRWTMTKDFGGDGLNFKKIHDPCKMRVGLLTGGHWGRVN